VCVVILGAGLPGLGDASLIAAGTLAGEGKLNVWIVLATAMVAWMVGSVIGFQIGWRGGRPLLDHPGRLETRRRNLLAMRSMCAWCCSFSPASHGMLVPPDRAVAARAITAGAAPLTKHRITGRPAVSVAELNVAISLYVGSNGSVASRGQLLAGRVDVHPGLVAEHEQGALGGVAHDLAVHQLGVAGHQVGQDRVLYAGGGARGVLDLAVQPVTDTRDPVAVGRVHHLDRGHLVSWSGCRSCRS
jgi:hypothetical protein